MFRQCFVKISRFLISGAESGELVHQNSTNHQPSVLVNKANDGQIELIIHDVSTIFSTFISWYAIKFLMWGLKLTRAVPEKHKINFFGLMYLTSILSFLFVT